MRNSALGVQRRSVPARPISGGAGEYGSLSEFLRSVAKATQGNEPDSRLIRAPTGASETNPTIGGFLVPTVFAQELVGIAYEQSVIADLCDQRTTTQPLASTKFPGIDEISRADGSRWGGAITYWAGEGDQVASSLPRFKLIDVAANKLISLVFGTTELMNDAPMWEAHIKRVFGAEMGFKLDLAALKGTGAGVPLGILNSPATIVVPEETSQTAATIVAANISKMWSRLPAPSRRRAVWLVNEDAEGQFDALSDAGKFWYNAAGTNGSPFPLLKGRPVLAIEQASPLGTVGDIVLADLDHYVIVDGGFQANLSVDCQFINDQVVWRFVLRVDGKPAFTSPITPYNGTVTRSPFVTLAARS